MKRDGYRVERQGTEFAIKRGYRYVAIGIESQRIAHLIVRLMTRAWRQGWEDRKRRKAVMPPLLPVGRRG